jgi:glycerol-3-phosphate acyltransferase PlsY
VCGCFLFVFFFRNIATTPNTYQTTVMCGKVAALQLTSQLVRVDRRKSADAIPTPGEDNSLGSRAFIVRAAMNVRGVAVSETHLAVWNGTQAQVFELGEMAAEQVCVQNTNAKVGNVMFQVFFFFEGGKKIANLLLSCSHIHIHICITHLSRQWHSTVSTCSEPLVPRCSSAI